MTKSKSTGESSKRSATHHKDALPGGGDLPGAPKIPFPSQGANTPARKSDIVDLAKKSVVDLTKESVVDLTKKSMIDLTIEPEVTSASRAGAPWKKSLYAKDETTPHFKFGPPDDTESDGGPDSDLELVKEVIKVTPKAKGQPKRQRKKSVPNFSSEQVAAAGNDHDRVDLQNQNASPTISDSSTTIDNDKNTTSRQRPSPAHTQEDLDNETGINEKSELSDAEMSSLSTTTITAEMNLASPKATAAVDKDKKATLTIVSSGSIRVDKPTSGAQSSAAGATAAIKRRKKGIARIVKAGKGGKSARKPAFVADEASTGSRNDKNRNAVASASSTSANSNNESNKDHSAPVETSATGVTEKKTKKIPANALHRNAEGDYVWPKDGKCPCERCQKRRQHEHEDDDEHDDGVLA